MKKLPRNHWYARFLRATDGIFRNNPVLSLGLALPFAAVAVTSLQTAVGLAIGALLTLVPVSLLLLLFEKLLPENCRWLDLPLCALTAAVFVLPIRLVTGKLSPALMDSVGVYFSLLCVSSALFALREETRGSRDWAKVLLLGVKQWLGLSLVFLLVGFLRELLGYGTLWGKALPWMKVRFSGAMVTGIGLILLGFLAALGKKIHRSYLGCRLWWAESREPLRRKLRELLDSGPAGRGEDARRHKKARKDKKALPPQEKGQPAEPQAEKPATNEESTTEAQGKEALE